MPLTRNWSASIRCEFSSRRGPGGLSASAAWTFWRSWSAIPWSFVSMSVTLSPGVVSTVATALPFAVDWTAILETWVM